MLKWKIESFDNVLGVSTSSVDEFNDKNEVIHKLSIIANSKVNNSIYSIDTSVTDMTVEVTVYDAFRETVFGIRAILYIDPIEELGNCVDILQYLAALSVAVSKGKREFGEEDANRITRVYKKISDLYEYELVKSALED